MTLALFRQSFWIQVIDDGTKFSSFDIRCRRWGEIPLGASAVREFHIPAMMSTHNSSWASASQRRYRFFPSDSLPISGSWRQAFTGQPFELIVWTQNIGLGRRTLAGAVKVGFGQSTPSELERASGMILSTLMAWLAKCTIRTTALRTFDSNH